MALRRLLIGTDRPQLYHLSESGDIAEIRLRYVESSQHYTVDFLDVQNQIQQHQGVQDARVEQVGRCIDARTIRTAILQKGQQVGLNGRHSLCTQLS